MSFNHERILTLWEPARRVNVDDASEGPPFIEAFHSEFDPAFPGDYDLAGRRRSALRAFVGRSEAWPQVGRSALEYGLVWAPNGSKISLAGGVFPRTIEFEAITVVARFDLDWRSPAPAEGDLYAQVVGLLDKDGGRIGGFGRTRRDGVAGSLGSSIGTEGVGSAGASGDLVRLWYRAAEEGQAGSGRLRVERWDPSVGGWALATSEAHSDPASVSRLLVGLQLAHTGGAPFGAAESSVAWIAWDTDRSSDGPAELAYDPDRAVIQALGDVGKAGDGLRANVRTYTPLGEFDHEAPASTVEVVAGSSADLSDGVVQPGGASLVAGGEPEYVRGLAITLMPEGSGTRALANDERVYWRLRVTLGGDDQRVVEMPRVHSLLTPPDPEGEPQRFRLGFLSCHSSSGDAQPILAYRLFRERGCRFVLRLGDNGYNDSQVFGINSDVTGPWAAQEVEDLLTALLPTYLDPELALTGRSIPMWDQGDDHDYVVNNWHAGFTNSSMWSRAGYPVNSRRQRIEYLGEAPAFKARLTGAQSGREARYLGEGPNGTSVLGFVSNGPERFNGGEAVLNDDGETVGTVTGVSRVHGWGSPGAALFYMSAEQVVANGVSMWNAWQGIGFERLGALEVGAAPDRATALERGHYYRSFETAKTLVLMLDNRRFQEPAPAEGDSNQDRSFLGQDQLEWAKSKLDTTTKPLVVIGTTGVVGDVHTDDDNWFALPSWRQELYDLGLAADSNDDIERVLFLAGDRHSTFAHSSRLQGEGDPDPGFWTLGTEKAIEFDAGPSGMSALRDDANNDSNYQYRFRQVPRGDVQGKTAGWVDMIPANAAPLDPVYIVDGDIDEVVHFSTLLAKRTDRQGETPPKRAQMAGTVEIDEANETFTLRAWDCEADLATPVVGQADESHPDPYAAGRLLWARTFPFALGGAPCPSDLNDDGTVDANDLAVLIAAWGSDGPSDLNGSGGVDAVDLAVLISSWGACE